MTATRTRKPGQTKDGRYRIYDSSVRHLVWKTEAEMSPDDWAWFHARHPDPAPSGNGHAAATDVTEPTVEQLRRQLAALQAQINATAESPAAPQSAPVEPQGNRYAGRIRQYEERIAVLKQTVNNATESDDRRGRAATDIEQFQEAIDMLNEAAQIGTDETAWFVSNQSDFRVMIPPVLPGIYNRDMHRIESYNMYYHAKDPIHIAVLRRTTKDAGSHIHEMPVGTFPIMDWETRSFEGWGSWQLFAARDAKRYKAI